MDTLQARLHCAYFASMNPTPPHLNYGCHPTDLNYHTIYLILLIHLQQSQPIPGQHTVLLLAASIVCRAILQCLHRALNTTLLALVP